MAFAQCGGGWRRQEMAGGAAQRVEAWRGSASRDWRQPACLRVATVGGGGDGGVAGGGAARVADELVKGGDGEGGRGLREKGVGWGGLVGEWGMGLGLGFGRLGFVLGGDAGSF
ncbi:unnamed protein product [Linum trigynum]|uniref:Uncharacterized protein n=1 Tax=Linum trigynum TaxID=586398 RepID=A0AAV2EUD5_9ROSI